MREIGWPAGLGLLFAAVVLLVPGCLKRKETIRVARDGSVQMRVELEGDPGDFSKGDVVPAERTGWKTQDEIVTDKDGKEKQHLVATQRFASGRSLPDSFADPRGPQYGVALMFPTALDIERRSDGTYYHFKRVYESRTHAPYSIHHELLKNELDALKELGGKEPEELTDQDRRRVISVLRTLEALKQVEYVAAGVAALEDQWPQDHGLLLRRATLDHFENADVEQVVELLGEPQTPERDAAIDAFGVELVATARDMLRRKMQELHVPSSQIELFFVAYDEEEARRAVTEDLDDEHWEVRVELPGEIVAHNGTGVDGRFVVWEFPGKVMFDRDHVLMVTSRVTRGASRHSADE